MTNKIKVESIKEENLSESDKSPLPLTKWKTIKGGSETRFLSEQIDSILYG